MNYDKKCKWHKSCGYDFCHGEGICPEFEKGKITKGSGLRQPGPLETLETEESEE